MAEEGYDSQARDMASEAMSVARQALETARDAERTAQNAENLAEQALREIAALVRRVDLLEDTVRELIHMLERKLQELIDETEQVRGAVETQGQQIREGVDKTTESVSMGFTSASHQEVRGRLLDSRTALMGLATKLSTARHALYGEFDQARRRTDELKIRYTEAFDRTVSSLKRDIERLGSLILRVQAEDFRKTIEEHLPAARKEDGVFQMAKQVGSASLVDRNAAMKAHLDRATADSLGQFEQERAAFLAQLRGFMHTRLKADAGDYAMRVYVTDGHAGRECLAAATIEPEQNHLAFRRVDTGLGRVADQVTAVWDQPGSARQLTAEERARVEQYVRHIQSQGLLSAEESGIILHHLDRNPLTILNPSVESVHATRA